MKALIDSFKDDALALGGEVEINILDNASTDSTDSIARSFPLLPINYQRHEVNLGAIKNIHLAHRLGSGRYVWIIGDDDFLMPGQLLKIFAKLADDCSLVLMSYSRVTPAGTAIGKVSIGETDRLFDKDSTDFNLAQIDSLIGFLSANIIERSWIENISLQQYDELDSRGELAHAAICYAPIVAGRKIQYIAGQPLSQTVDNGYLRHSMWVHVCVKYCINLPKQLVAMGFPADSTKSFFRKRLWRECVRRMLSEKYRGQRSAAVVTDPEVRNGMGWRMLTLWILVLVPSRVVRFTHDLLRPQRN